MNIIQMLWIFEQLLKPQKLFFGEKILYVKLPLHVTFSRNKTGARKENLLKN